MSGPGQGVAGRVGKPVTPSEPKQIKLGKRERFKKLLETLRAEQPAAMGEGQVSLEEVVGARLFGHISAVAAGGATPLPRETRPYLTAISNPSMNAPNALGHTRCRLAEVKSGLYHPHNQMLPSYFE